MKWRAPQTVSEMPPSPTPNRVQNEYTTRDPANREEIRQRQEIFDRLHVSFKDLGYQVCPKCDAHTGRGHCDICGYVFPWATKIMVKYPDLERLITLRGPDGRANKVYGMQKCAYRNCHAEFIKRSPSHRFCPEHGRRRAYL
jgi:hypothetical protein